MPKPNGYWHRLDGYPPIYADPSESRAESRPATSQSNAATQLGRTRGKSTQ